VYEGNWKNTSCSLSRIGTVSGSRRQEVRESCGKSNIEKGHDLYSSAEYGVIKPLRMSLVGHVVYVSLNDETPVSQ